MAAATATVVVSIASEILPEPLRATSARTWRLATLAAVNVPSTPPAAHTDGACRVACVSATLVGMGQLA